MESLQLRRKLSVAGFIGRLCFTLFCSYLILIEYSIFVYNNNLAALVTILLLVQLGASLFELINDKRITGYFFFLIALCFSVLPSIDLLIRVINNYKNIDYSSAYTPPVYLCSFFVCFTIGIYFGYIISVVYGVLGILLSIYSILKYLILELYRPETSLLIYCSLLFICFTIMIMITINEALFTFFSVEVTKNYGLSNWVYYTKKPKKIIHIYEVGENNYKIVPEVQI